MQEYIHEWDRLSVLCDINDPEELRVSRFIAGLKENIRQQLMITPDLTVHSAGLQAIELERLANRFTYAPKQTNRAYTPRNPNTTAAPKRDLQNSGQRASTVRGELPANLKDVVCFKCNGRGHYKRDFPNARAFTEGME